MKTTVPVLRSRSLRIALALLVPCVLSFGLFRVNLARRRAYVPLLNISVAPWKPGLGQGIDAIAWSPDGRSLAGADRWAQGYVFDADTGQGKRKWKRWVAGSMTWSRDGKMLAGSSSGTIQLNDATTGALLRRITPVHDANLLKTYQGQSIDCFVSPDASLGAAMQMQDSITVWNLRTGKQTLRLKAFKRPDGLRTEACGLAFSSDASQMAVARVLLDGGSRVKPEEWSDPGSWMARELEITLYDLRTRRPSHTWKWQISPNRRARIGVLFSPDDKSIAVSNGTFIQFCDAKSGAVGQQLTIASVARVSNQHPLAFSPNSKLIARAGANGDVEVWSVRSGQLLHTFHARDYLSDVKFSPDGKRLATSGGNQRDGFIKLWDTSFLQP